MPSGALLFQSVILGLLLGGLYALLAAGLTLYFGIMRVVMIAHSAFLILAAYLAWWSHREPGSTRCCPWSSPCRCSSPAACCCSGSCSPGCGR